MGNPQTKMVDKLGSHKKSARNVRITIKTSWFAYRCHQNEQMKCSSLLFCFSVRVNTPKLSMKITTLRLEKPYKLATSRCTVAMNQG